MVHAPFSNTTRILLTLIVVGVGSALLVSLPAAMSADAVGDDDFVTTWRVTASDLTITIPVSAATGTYSIDWGDNSNTSYGAPGSQSHTYASEGNYTVRISGDLAGVRLASDPANAQKLQSIEQWGSVQWSTMESAFAEADNMTYEATDSPDLSRVTDMSRIFSGASSFNGDISDWDVSGVTDMYGMFSYASSFNGDISDWDVSGVTDMYGMFSYASSFNGDISDWDVSSVTSMRHMFYTASSFNGDISDWDVSGVTDMYNMFYGASDFNQNLGPWYITLNDMHISDGDYAAEIQAQNPVLRGHNSSYSFAAGPGCTDNAGFAINNGVLTINSPPAQNQYVVCIGASGEDLFGTGNTRQITLGTYAAAQSDNQAPAADAGTDTAASERTTITLNGSASHDLDGDTLSYAWTAPAAITLIGANTATPSFTAPSVTSDTSYTLILNVSDGTLHDTATVTITVLQVNRAPGANAGADQTVSEGSAVTLDGSVSYDPDGDTLSYAWTAPAAITLSGANTATPSFTAPDVALHTNYTLILNVSDGALHDTDTVTITIQDAPAIQVDSTPPAAPTNLAATSTHDTVTLTWDDPGDSTITGYKVLSRIPANQQTLSALVNDTGSSASTYTVRNLQPGTSYEFAVAALNGSGVSPSSQAVTISTASPPPQPQPQQQAQPSPTQANHTAITANSGNVTINVPSDTGYTVALALPTSTTVHSHSVTLPNSLEISTSCEGTAILIELFANTTITGPPNWNDKITLPESVNVEALASLSSMGRVTCIVTIGLQNDTLTFDKPARVTFEGRAGDKAAIVGNAADTMMVDEVCASDDLAQIKAQIDQQNGPCIRNAGDDLEIWTDHFSSIASISSSRICR